ncbi:hypothetical protein TWF694_009918 [Orbilia ellipsospora]|uniref:HMG box domain-containing protein n=1 Tax=Orbilia ellipsospora TaxID=2528407 RepID=A0AAV9XCD4_9PEZI
MANNTKATEVGTKKARQSHNNKVPPDAPRRNLSSFVIFANSRRKELKEQYPDRAYPQIQSDISYEWEKLDSDGKEPWKKAMTDDKERYKKEMELYRKYGPGWVWVVGHKMRQDLGLTDEDCTQLQFPSSVEAYSSSLRPSRSHSRNENNRSLRRTRENPVAAPHDSRSFEPSSSERIDPSSQTDNTHPSYFELPVRVSRPEELLEYDDTLIPMSAHGSENTTPSVMTIAMSNSIIMTPRRSQIRNERNTDTCATPAYGDEIFPQGRDIDIFSPTVFDGFGLETPWADPDPDIDHYEWDS